MLNAGPFDPRGEPGAELLRQARNDLVAEKGRDVLGLNTQHRPADQLFIQRLQCGGGTGTPGRVAYSRPFCIRLQWV